MAVVGWILLGLLMLIVVILILPVGVSIEYLQTWQIRIKLFGFIPILTLPGDDSESKPEKPQPTVTPPPSEKEEKKDEEEDKPTLKEQLKGFYKQEGIKGVFSLLKALLDLATGTLRRVAHSMVISKLQLCVDVGGDQADKTAKRYAQMCSIVFPLVTTLSSAICMRKPQVRVQPDFLSESMSVRLRMNIFIFPLGILWAGLVALIKAIGVWMRVTKAAEAAAEKTTDSETNKTEMQEGINNG